MVFFYALGLMAAFQIGKELITQPRMEDVLVQCAIEAEGVVEIEIEGLHDGGGEIIE